MKIPNNVIVFWRKYISGHYIIFKLEDFLSVFASVLIHRIRHVCLDGLIQKNTNTNTKSDNTCLSKFMLLLKH